MKKIFKNNIKTKSFIYDLDQDVSISYSEINIINKKFSKILKKKKQLVILLAENSIDFIITYYCLIQNNFLVVVLIIVLNWTHNEILWIIGYLALIINFEKQIEMINFNQKKQH